MTKTVIRWTLAAYVVIAMALAAIIMLATPGIADIRAAALIGDFIGRAGAFLLLPGMIPLIVWAFGRFRAERAAVPLFLWGALAVVLTPLALTGEFYEGDKSLAKIPNNIAAFFTSDYDTFVRVVSNSCNENQRKHPLAGATDQQVSSFCSCYANALAKQLSPSELKDGLNRREGGLSAAVKEKIERAAPACRQSAFGHS